ncbi:MAG TPA: hypothetical protein VF624_02515 [Tepidisphaeraceae bacterium]|jgi:hypothetical protein
MRWRTGIPVYDTSTSPGGRVFGAVAGLACAGLAAGALWMAGSALVDAQITIRIGRGASRGPLTFDGWTTVVYGCGCAIAAVAFALYATGFAHGALATGESDSHSTWRWLRWGRVAFVSAGLVMLVAAAAEILD